MHRFQVDAILDPQSLPRVANFFAQRAIVPQALTMQLRPVHMRIEVDVTGLEVAQAEVIAAKLGRWLRSCDPSSKASKGRFRSQIGHGQP